MPHPARRLLIEVIQRNMPSGSQHLSMHTLVACYGHFGCDSPGSYRTLAGQGRGGSRPQWPDQCASRPAGSAGSQLSGQAPAAWLAWSQLACCHSAATGTALHTARGLVHNQWSHRAGAGPLITTTPGLAIRPVAPSQSMQNGQAVPRSHHLPYLGGPNAQHSRRC